MSSRRPVVGPIAHVGADALFPVDRDRWRQEPLRDRIVNLRQPLDRYVDAFRSNPGSRFF